MSRGSARRTRLSYVLLSRDRQGATAVLFLTSPTGRSLTVAAQ